MKSLVKKIVISSFLVVASFTAFSQIPQGFTYQAVVRDNLGKVRGNEMIPLDITILRGSASGTIVFTEPHAPVADDMGYISVVIGSQNSIDFRNIDWSNGPFYLQIEIDNILMGTTQLVSVPFAMLAKEAAGVEYANILNNPSWSDSIQNAIVNNSGYSITETDNLLANKADRNLVYSITQVDSLFTHKVETTMYTKTELDAMFALMNIDIVAVENTLLNKSDKSDTYTKTEVDALVVGKADASSVYSIAQSDDLLAAKADTNTVYSRTILDSRLNSKADIASVYTKAEVNTIANQKANSTDLGIVAFTGNYSDLTNEPTKVSDLTNDANYATVSMIPNETLVDSYVANNGFLLTETDPVYTTSIAKGITALDTANWNSKSEFDGAYASLTGKPDLSVYITTGNTYTKAQVDAAMLLKANTSSLGAVATTNNYNDLTNKPFNVSTFVNDANYATVSMIPTEAIVDGYVADNGYIASESDPVFNASAAKNITALNITSWNAKSDFDGAYASLTGKPDLSLYALLTGVYTKTQVDAALALKVNTAALATVATTNNYNDLSNKPTNVSSFTNDANYATVSMVPTEAIVDGYVANNGYISTESDPDFAASVSSSITAGDITYWNAKSNFDGAYASLTGKPDLSGYVTTTNTYTKTEVDAALALKASTASLGAVATSNNYNDLTNKPTIPTKVSDLANDAGYITTYSPLTEAEVDTYVSNNGYVTAEADPTFSVSAAKNITLANITAWNAKSDFDGAYASLTGKPDLSLYALNSSVYNKTFMDSALATKVKAVDLSAVATSGSYGDLTGSPSIPTDLGDLTNIAGYLKLADLPDNSVSNEIQTLSINTNQLTISGTGGNTVTFTGWDTDNTNDVILTGNQTIAGNKTFTGTVTVPTPVNNTDATNKAYVDALQSQINSLIAENFALDNQLSVMNLILLDAGYNGTVKDIDGNTYKTIKIGNQVWMAENLRTTTYNIGTAIDFPANATDWKNAISGAYAWLDDNPGNADTYGAIYNWNAVATATLCPTGWHVPTDAEWQTLETYLGMADAANFNYRGTIEGTELKSTSLWDAGGIAGTNTSKFSALPGGNRSNATGNFSNETYYGYFWTSTSFNASTSWYRIISYDVETVYRNYMANKEGMSVRCVKD